jgi:hypothetical protein
VARYDADSPEERLEGCFAMVEDELFTGLKAIVFPLLHGI